MQLHLEGTSRDGLMDEAQGVLTTTEEWPRHPAATQTRLQRFYSLAILTYS